MLLPKNVRLWRVGGRLGAVNHAKMQAVVGSRVITKINKRDDQWHVWRQRYEQRSQIVRRASRREASLFARLAQKVLMYFCEAKAS